MRQDNRREGGRSATGDSTTGKDRGEKGGESEAGVESGERTRVRQAGYSSPSRVGRGGLGCHSEIKKYYCIEKLEIYIFI